MTTYKYKTIGFIVLILATILNAVPNEKPAETTMAPEDGTIGNSSVFSDQDLDEPDTPAYQAIAKGLEEVKQKICEALLGECWLLYEGTKPYLEEEQRETICFKRIRGFGSCLHLTEAEMKRAKEDVKKRQKLEQEQAAEKEKKDAERKKKLDKLKEEWAQIRIKGRGESAENCTSEASTTIVPAVTVSQDGLDGYDASEGSAMSKPLSTNSIEIDS